MCNNCDDNNGNNSDSTETDDNTVVCDSCESIIDKDDAFLAPNESWLCDSCFSDRYFYCDRCGDRCDRDSSYCVDNDETWCDGCADRCAYSCTNCGDYHSRTNITECGCGDYYCEDCISEHQSDCPDCVEEINLHDHADSLIRHGSGAIADYHPEVDWLFKSDKLDDYRSEFFGIELEIECSSINTTAKRVGELLKGRALASHDGSLNNGFEIVLTPHRYQAFRNIDWHNILRQLSATGATSYDKGTCGLHVHLGKTGYLKKEFCFRGNWYSGGVVYKQFFTMLQNDITRFSQRKEEQIERYCQFSTSNHDRYSAVNLCPDNTIEVRIFRGTLNYDRFMASIQFSHAVLQFLTTHSAALVLGGNSLRLKRAFRDWLKTRGEYALLVKYFERKGLFGFPPVYDKKPVKLTGNPVPVNSETGLASAEL